MSILMFFLIYMDDLVNVLSSGVHSDEQLFKFIFIYAKITCLFQIPIQSLYAWQTLHAHKAEAGVQNSLLP